MDNVVATPRTALLAGAAGVAGRAPLLLLLASTHYRRVHFLLRRMWPEIKASAELEIHQVDFTRLPATFPAVDDVFIALGITIKVAGSKAAFRQVVFLADFCRRDLAEVMIASSRLYSFRFAA